MTYQIALDQGGEVVRVPLQAKPNEMREAAVMAACQAADREGDQQATAIVWRDGIMIGWIEILMGEARFYDIDVTVH